MPVYEFRCNQCQHPFEIRTAKMAPPENLACPECGGKEVRRLISSFFAHSAQKTPAALPSEACRQCGGGSNPNCPFSQ